MGLQETFFLQMGAAAKVWAAAHAICILQYTITIATIPAQYKIICNICQNSHKYKKTQQKNEGALHPVQWSGFAFRMM